MTAQHRRVAFWGLALVVAALLACVLGAGVGSTGFESVWHVRDDPSAWRIVWDIRLPRTFGAWLAGALLGLSGALAQGLFRNPLADPYLLGSASGASMGVAFVVAFCGASPVAAQWLGRLGLTGAAFIGAACAVMATMVLARGVQHTLRLLLAGVIVGVVLSAFNSLMMLRYPAVMQVMQTFILGSTAFIGWTALGLMAVVWSVCALAAWGLSRVLDGLALGENTAMSLGLRLAPLRAMLIVVLALAIGTAVAQTGLIAFVGLASPHLVRSLVKTTHNRLIFLSSLMGGALLLAADLLARWVIAPQELPVGVLTALIGGIYLLWRMHAGNVRAGGA